MMTKVISKGGAERKLFWRRVVARWEQSDLDSMADFCRLEKIPVREFYRWRDRLMAADSGQGEMAFLPVKTDSVHASESTLLSNHPIRLEIGGNMGITLHDGFDPKLLRSVVAALT